MITAKEARELTINNFGNTLDELMNDVEAEIKDACSKGYSSTAIRISYSYCKNSVIFREFRDRMALLGYTVHIHWRGQHSNGDMPINISWRENEE